MGLMIIISLLKDFRNHPNYGKVIAFIDRKIDTKKVSLVELRYLKIMIFLEL